MIMIWNNCYIILLTRRSILLYIFIFGISCASGQDVEFDSDKWKNWEETETTLSLRWDMKEDLIKKHKLIDLTQDEIVYLLGDPDQKTANSFQYYLGVARRGIDYGTLMIDFEKGKVIDFRIISG